MSTIPHMPPCIVRALHLAAPRIRPYIILRRPDVLGERLYASGNVSETFRRERKDILAALHRANAILPKILPPPKVATWSGLIDTWSGVLSGTTFRKVRIAVLGLDELSQPTELISALLEDPLSSDKQNTNVLRARRRKSSTDPLLIKYGDLDGSNTTLSINLPWLKRLDVEILEIPAAHPDCMTLLYDADFQILVASPLSTSLARPLEPLLPHPGSFLILNYPVLDQQVISFTLSRLFPSSLTLSDAVKNKILQIYPPRALSALDMFRQGTNSVESVQAFQDEFLSSGVPKLSQALSQALSLDQENRTSRSAVLALAGALKACGDAVQDASQETATVQKLVKELKSRVYSVQSTSMQDVLVGDGAFGVAEAVERSTRDMRHVMNTLQWWQLPFRVDDLSDSLSNAVHHAWFRDLGAKLQFQSGRLSSLGSAMTAEAHTTLRLLPPSFQSAILENSLCQLSARPPDLAPSTLTQPLAYRLQQLRHTILSLHRRAQRIVLAAIVTMFGSLGGAYAAWLLGCVSSPTAVGFGTLGAVTGLRWLAGSWERGRSRWWQDWHRVSNGLERDLKNIHGLTVQEKVTAVATEAAVELEKSLARRWSEIKNMNTELESLQSDSDPLYRRHMP